MFINPVLKKFVVIVLVIALMSAIAVPAFAADSIPADIKEKAYLNGSTFNGDASENKSHEKEVDLEFSYSWLTSFCNNTFNKGLALFANMVSLDMYGNSYARRADQTSYGFGHQYDGQFIKAMGFEDFELKTVEKPGDYDGTDIAMGHRLVTSGDITYNVFVAGISGTRNENDWVSNFDIGADTDAYRNVYTGDTTDWANTEYHKGFGIAANRTELILNKYIKDNSVDGAVNTLLVTGHSRGGAIANLLGAYYEGRDDIYSYTYTFSSPKCTKAAGNYESIFNIVNDDDFVCAVPLGSWGFARYGSDIALSINGSDDAKAIVNSLKYGSNKYSAMSAASKTALLKAFETLSKTSDNLYEPVTIPEDPEDAVTVEVPGNITGEEAVKEYIETEVFPKYDTYKSYNDTLESLDSLNKYIDGSSIDMHSLFWYTYREIDETPIITSMDAPPENAEAAETEECPDTELLQEDAQAVIPEEGMQPEAEEAITSENESDSDTVPAEEITAEIPEEDIQTEDPDEISSGNRDDSNIGPAEKITADIPDTDEKADVIQDAFDAPESRTYVIVRNYRPAVVTVILSLLVGYRDSLPKDMLGSSLNIFSELVNDEKIESIVGSLIAIFIFGGSMDFASPHEALASYSIVCVTPDSAVCHSLKSKVITPATETTPGLSRCSCNNCSFVFDSIIQPGEHKHVLSHVKALPPTAKTSGNTEYWVCYGCGKFFADAEGTTEISKADWVIPGTGDKLSGTAHVQSYGDLTGKYDGNTLSLGTRGESKRLESVTVGFNNNTGFKGDIEYRVHCQGYGWLPWTSSGNPAGTHGESKRLEAIQMRLTGEIADYYSIMYKVHVQNIGDQDWKYDGELAGTTALSFRLENLEVRLVPKTTKVMGIEYKVHRQTYGWENICKTDGAVSGTTGESKRLEGICANLTGTQYKGSVRYCTHVQTYGWQDWREDGMMSGTTGQSKRLEAIKIELTGEVSKHYDVYYRVHAQTYGWLGWVKNGQPSGTEGLSKRLEAIQIKLVEKGQAGPVSDKAGFVRK